MHMLGHRCRLARARSIIRPGRIFAVRGVESLPERLVSDQRAVGQLLLALLEPGQHLRLHKTSQALGVGSERFLFLLQFVRTAREHVRPPFARFLAQRGESCVISIVSQRAEGTLANPTV
jgi:hypothetical protein